MKIDIRLRLGILRPGIVPHIGGDVQTEAEYDALVEWPDGAALPKPTWAEVLALGDIELDAAKDQAIKDIDVAAGNARARYVSDGDMVVDEYRLAYDEALAYKVAGYTGEVADSLQAWVDGSDFTTAQQAADDIIATKPILDAVLSGIRLIRLPGKHNVRNAADSAGIISARDAAIALLDAV